MNSESEAVIGAKIRPVDGSRGPRLPDCTIVAIDGDDFWVRPISQNDGPPFTVIRKVIYTEWETWISPDATNHMLVQPSDIIAGGISFDVGRGESRVQLDGPLALNLAAWILQLINPGYWEWADLQQAVSDLRAASGDAAA